MNRLSAVFPLLSWLPSYSRTDFRGDLVAGLTVGVMLIPQGMAYALLAGVPPIYGLYASIVPLIAYTIFGTSRHMAVGIMAIDSLVVVAALGTFADVQTEEFIALAVVLTVMTGLIQIIMGIARFGFVVALLSRPVISGFTAAAALTIAFSQLKSLLRLPLPSTPDIFVLMWETANQLGDIHLLSVGIGGGAILLLVLLRRFVPVAPGALIAVVAGILVVWGMGLDQNGVEIVGVIPTGLPRPSLPAFSVETIRDLFPTAITLSLIQFMTVISLGKVFAAKHSYTINPNKELIAVGTQQVLGGLFQSVPVSGSFSRSAVSEQTGARTPMANTFAALVIVLTVLFLTPVFFYLPIPVFAAIIIVSAFAMIDVGEVRFLLRVKRADGLIALVTFAATLLIGIQEGVLVGVAASITAIMFRISRPKMPELGHLPSSRLFRELERYPEARPVEGIFLLRVDASFGFANADLLRTRILSHCEQHPEVRAVIIDANSVNDLDTTAVAILQHVASTLERRGIRLVLAGVKSTVMDIIRLSPLIDDLGPEAFHMSPHRAVLAVLSDWGLEAGYLNSVQAESAP